MHDLTSADREEDAIGAQGLYRSRSRESLYDDFPKHRHSEPPLGQSTPVPARRTSQPEDVESPQSAAQPDVDRNMRGRSPQRNRSLALTSYVEQRRNKNETDESKMAKSGELGGRLRNAGTVVGSPHGEQPFTDLMYMKKGWLLKLNEIDQEWTKHWFVLSGISLRYFQDAKAEDSNTPDGSIDMAACFSISEANVSRNYGFILKTRYGDYTLSAMTSGIRTNWMQAIQKCMEMSEIRSNSNGAFPKSPRSNDVYSTGSSSSNKTSRNSSPWRRSHSPSPAPSSRWRSPGSDPRSPTSSYSRTPLHEDRGQNGVQPPTTDSRKFKPRQLDLEKDKSPSPARAGYTCTWPYVKQDSVGTPESPTSTSSLQNGAGFQHSRNDSVSSTSSTGSRSRTFVLMSTRKDDAMVGDQNGSYTHSGSHQSSPGPQSPQGSPRREKAPQTPTRSKHRGSSSGQVSKAQSPSYNSGQQRSPQSERSKRQSSPGPQYATRQSSPGPQRGRNADSDRARSPSQPKAPSAKVKDKSRSKSPRPRSPPPVQTTGQDGKKTDGWGLRNFNSDLLNGSPGKESKGSSIQSNQVSSSRADVSGGDASSVTSARDSALVDLLETEVESLKAQLEKTQTDMGRLQQINLDLKTQIRSFRRDHKDSLDNMESDQSRYMSQIEDIQDQMEHTTEFLQTRINEHENHSELTKLQVQNLKQQIQEAHSTIQAQQKQITDLQANLDITNSELSTAGSALSQSVKDVTHEKDKNKKKQADWDRRVKDLERQIAELHDKVQEKQEDLDDKENSMKALKADLEKRSTQCDSLEKELGDLAKVKQRLEEKSSNGERMRIDLEASRRQIRDMEHDLSVKEKEHKTSLKKIQDSYSLEKSKLEEQIVQMQKRVDSITKQSTIADSLNSNMTDILREKDETIAQLEEKLIENDSKIDELSEELKMEIDDNTAMQQNLDKSYEETARLKRDLELAKKEVNKLNTELQNLHKEIELLKTHIREQEIVKEHLGNDIENGVKRISKLEHENSKLKSSLEHNEEQISETQKWKQETKNYQQKYELLEDECDGLKTRCQQLESELAYANEESEKYKQEVYRVKEQHEEDMKRKYEDLRKANSMADGIQQSLSSEPTTSSHSKEKVKEGDVEWKKKYKELEDKYEKSMDTLRRLRADLNKAHATIDEMELARVSREKGYQAMDNDYRNQLGLMSSRVEDLAAKLALSERKVRKLEKKVARKDSKIKPEDIAEIAKRQVEGRGADDMDGDIEGKDEIWSSSDSSPDRQLKPTDVKSLEVALKQSQQAEKELGEKLHRCDDHIAFLECKIQETSEGAKDKDMKGQLEEVEIELGYTQAMLEECRHKISDTIMELETFGMVPTKDSSAVDRLKSRLEQILKDSQATSHQSSKIHDMVKVDDSMKLYAERLSLEAVILGEMAQLARCQDEKPYLREREKSLVSIYQANRHILDLEHKLGQLKSDVSCSQRRIQSTAQQSIKSYSTLLADKLVVQAQMTMLLEYLSHNQREAGIPVTAESKSFSTEALGQEALLWSSLDQNLIRDINSNQEIGSYVASLAPSALVQGEFSFVLEKLKKQASAFEDEQERIDSVDKELGQCQEKLLERRSAASQQVDSFRNDHIEKVTLALMQDNTSDILISKLSDLGHDTSKLPKPTRNKFSKDNIGAKISALIEMYAAKHASSLQFHGASHSNGKQYSLIDAAIQEEIISSLSSLDKVYDVCITIGETLSEEECVDTVLNFVDVVSYKAVINGQVAFIAEMVEDFPPIGNKVSTTQSDDCELLSFDLSAQSSVRQHLAESFSKSHDASSSDVGQAKRSIVQLATKLAALDKELNKCGSLSSYHYEKVRREAVFQAQLAFIVRWLRRVHEVSENKLREELVKENDIGVSIAQDAYVAELEQEVDRLSEAVNAKQSLNESLEDEVFGIKSSHFEELQNMEKEHNRQLSELETSHQRELVTVKREHQQELEQVRKEMKAAAEGIEAVEIGRLEEEAQELRVRLEEERTKYVRELEKLREEVAENPSSVSGVLIDSHIQQLETKIQSIQADYEKELMVTRNAHKRQLQRSNDEMLELLAVAEAKSIQVDEDVIRKKYMKEIDRIKELYDKGFASMERSHQRVLMEMRQTHKREIDSQRQEKEQLLAEETKATQAALDAMRKAHESEMKKERNKFLDVIAKTYSQSDVESLQRQHEEDLELIQHEIRQLSEQYSIKCLENAALEERLEVQTRALQDSRSRVHKLMARNEELNLKLRQDIDKLNKLVLQRASPLSPLNKEGESQEVIDLKIAARVKEAELQMLEEERNSLKEQLHATTEELEDHLEKYTELHSDYEKIRERYEHEIDGLRNKLMDMPTNSLEGHSTEEQLVEQTSEEAKGEELERPVTAHKSSREHSRESSTASSIHSYEFDRSPSPKRSKVGSRSRNPERNAGRALPTVPTELRHMKKNLWRQRQPQRAMSVPSIPQPLSFGASMSDLSRDRSESPETILERDKKGRPHTSIGLPSK